MGEELVQAFSLDRVSKAGAKFDPDKTKWYQQQYLRGTDDEKLASLVSKQRGLSYIGNTLFRLVNTYYGMSGTKAYNERHSAIAGLQSDGYVIMRKQQLNELLPEKIH